MWRYLIGAVGALVLVAGGLLWWRTTAMAERTSQRAAFAASVGEVDSNGDGLPDPPQADEKSKEQKRFARTDHDKDGKISRDEYLSLRHKNFAKLDKNGDGVLSFDEYAAKAIDKFGEADANKNGSLDPAEFATTRVQRKSKPRANCPPATHEDQKADEES